MTSEPDGKNKLVIVLDTSALIGGFDPFSVKDEQYTPPKVREELTEETLHGLRLKTAIENGRIQLKTPEETSVEKTKTFAFKLGDSFFLSETDIQVLALALELKEKGYSPIIATDDYSIQNVATRMGIHFAPITTFGIRRQLEWMRYCPACHKKYPANYKSRKCEVCGTDLKRKSIRKAQTLREQRV